MKAGHLHQSIPSAPPMLFSENCECISGIIDTSPRQKNMTVCFYNTMPVGHSEKYSEIELFVGDELIDILMPTETWFLHSKDKCVKMAPAAYTL